MSSIKDFEILSTLGSGSFSSVYKVKRVSDSQEYAMKKVYLPRLSQKEKENALNEVRILASITNKNIIGYKEAFYDDASQSLCIIMEYASGGDLLQIVSDYKKRATSIPEETIWSYLIQITQGLKTLHDMKILHRDLKCANIFLASDGNTIKLGDLNVSKIAEKGLVHTQAGTPYYASPEIWQDKPYGHKSDIWSLGCVIYELCSLVPPFRASDMGGLYQRVLKGAYDPIPSCYSPELSKLIAMCLNTQPALRPCCSKILSYPSIKSRMAGCEVKTVKKVPVFKDLLDTIKLPANLKKLVEILPKPNYKPRESLSLADLDKFEDDIKKCPQNRPLSRINRMDSKSTKNLYQPSNGDESKRESRENSLEKIIKSKDPKTGEEGRKNPGPILPINNIKGVGKLNAGQIAGKAALMEIFKSRGNVPKILKPLQLENIQFEGDGKLPVISRPSSRRNRPVVNLKEIIQNGLRDYNSNERRPNTPILRPRKAPVDVMPNNARIIKKEESVNQSDLEARRIVKPIY